MFFIRMMGHVPVVVCIEYLRAWWHFIYATSLIVPIFMRYHLSWPDSSILSDIFIHYGYLVHYISYMAMTTCDICYYAYSWPLYSYVYGTATSIFAITWWDLSLYCTNEWLVLPPGYLLLHFWDGYNVFWPSCYPSDLPHLGASIIADFTTLGRSHLYGLLSPSTNSLNPPCSNYTLMS